jgi:hypothetical protein
MKVKFLIQPEWQSSLKDGVEAFEATVNDWIADNPDKKVIDIKYQVDRSEAGAFVFKSLSVMIVYEDISTQAELEK